MPRLFRCCFFIICLVLVSCVGKTIIINNIPERDANEILVLLSMKGINATKSAAPVTTVGGGAAEQMWDIAVDPSKITEALAILNQAGLPRVKGTSLLDLFGSSGLVPSDLQDRIRYQEGLSEQLATTIRKMDGIIDANVQITFPSTDEEVHKPLTASVYVKHRGILDNPNSLMITKIKRLVSSAIPGLTLENVSVVTDRALYSDITLPEMMHSSQENAEFVSIWSIIVTKESASRFRLIFYVFLILIFILLGIIIWLLWKISPLLRTPLGYKVLFTPKPFEAPLPPFVEINETENTTTEEK